MDEITKAGEQQNDAKKDGKISERITPTLILQCRPGIRAPVARLCLDKTVAANW